MGVSYNMVNYSRDHAVEELVGDSLHCFHGGGDPAHCLKLTQSDQKWGSKRSNNNEKVG